MLKTGASSLLLRDALRRPLAEIELGEVDASLRRVDSNVTRVRFTLQQCKQALPFSQWGLVLSDPAILICHHFVGIHCTCVPCSILHS